MNVFEQARKIFEGPSIEDKLFPIKYTKAYEESFSLDPSGLPDNPSREKKVRFSDIQIKFPSKGKMVTPEGAGLALHFFANHELLAIEMMAYAILKFPKRGEEGDKIRQGLISTIRDEQKHFQLYCQRMKDFGVEFGDFPLNDFFWRQIQQCKDINSFYAILALTFESANLDFAHYYRDLFKEHDDSKTSEILNIVLEDEIRHVNIGWNLLNKKIENQSMWDYYTSLLPEKISPARAKGNVFKRELRKKSGMSEEFINDLDQYRGNFKITKRKSWD